MQYINYYQSPLGQMTMTSNGEDLTRLFFTDAHLAPQGEVLDLAVFQQARQWLDTYFQGKQPSSVPLFKLEGTDFQKAVWSILLTIPYGKTTSYRNIAQEIAQQRGIKSMSAQAVGGSVGRNPICLIVPCHRVIGVDGSMTGYAEGIERKVALLKLEQSL